jgi:hypothetical protein
MFHVEQKNNVFSWGNSPPLQMFHVEHITGSSGINKMWGGGGSNVPRGTLAHMRGIISETAANGLIDPWI